MRKARREEALLTAIKLIPGVSGYTLGKITNIGVTKLYPDLNRLKSRGLIERKESDKKPNIGGWYIVEHKKLTHD